MAKLVPKAIVKPFAADELNPDFQPTPIGDYASEGEITRSYDPEVLLERSGEGLSAMTVKTSDGKVVLPPSGDIAGLEYAITYCLKALQQSGIAEYTPKQDYHFNDIVKAPSGFKIYRSLDNDNIGNPLTNSSKWEELDLLALKQATTSQRGTLQIATTSDINTGTDNTKALTVANLRASNINFTGSPTAPTQATSDNSTKLATTAYVNNKIADNIIYFSARNNITQNLNTFIKITFLEKELDNIGCFNDSRFTVKVKGVYSLNFSLGANPGNTQEHHLVMHIYRNNSLFRYGASYNKSGFGAISTTIVIACAVGDYFEVFANTSTQANATTDGRFTQFSGHLIERLP